MMRLSLFYTALSFLCACSGMNDRIVPVALRTEYQVAPLGIDTQSPRFTWEYDGKDNSFVVKAYEVRIGTKPDSLSPYSDTLRLLPHTRYYWNVAVRDEKGRPGRTSETATFETAKFSLSDWSAKWITDRHDKEYEPAPMFRKSFDTGGKKVREARAYVAAAGYQELFINGKKVGADYLDPGFTYFDQRTLYVTHDVTSLLQTGENVVSAVLGNGFYNMQSVALWKLEQAPWRDRPRLLAELRIVYDDGTVETVVTDETWRTATGPYTYNCLYSGDKYDARLERDGWQTVGFDDSGWQQAHLVAAPAPLLVSRQMPGIRVTETFEPVSLKRFGDRLYVYSFPKNFSGFCRLKVKGERGTRIVVRHGELLKPDGRLEQANIDVYYHPVKPDEFFQTDMFTLKGTGEEEVFTPSFTYHGFQYVEIESSRPIELEKENLTGLFVHTDLRPVGSFACSMPLLNKIWDATMQSYRSNLHSIPTDCPQREKNGWTADAHVAVDLGLLGFDGITFYEKWMDDFRDCQARDSSGGIAAMIPAVGGYGWVGPVWDAALFIIPDALYHYYGDTACIAKMYPCMLRYLDYMKTREADGGYIQYGLGDWLFWKRKAQVEFTSTAYYFREYQLMARFAGILGKDSLPFTRKADALKELINRKFFNPETGVYANGTQTGQALALYFGLVPDGKEQMVADKLHEYLEADDFFLNFGLIGTKTVPAMLAKYGYMDDAMKMITKTDAPSWGYWIDKLGYTTLPETWTLSPVFKDASLNHVFFGDVAAWMMNQLAGINYDPVVPGFRRIRITPHFVKELEWAEGRYHSVAGPVRSRWERKDGQVVLTVDIPMGTDAVIEVGDDFRRVGSGTHTFIYDN